MKCHNGIAAILFTCLAAVQITIADTLQFKGKEGTKTIEGNLLGKDSTGTVLFEGRDTQRFLVDGKNVVSLQTGAQVPLYSKQQLVAHLRKELGSGFHIETRLHYVIAYSCEPVFAEQAGQILEHVYAYFVNYFRNKGGFRFPALKQPLVAIIYKSRPEYLAAVKELGGESLEWSGGVYVQQSNRFYTYQQKLEIEPKEVVAAYGRAAKAEPDAVQPSVDSAIRSRNVQVIVHEGIHQIAYNLGFHNRSSYNPKWLVEGMAMFFESANLDSEVGWSGGGEINAYQLEVLRKTLPRLKEGFLQALVVDDTAFMNGATNSEAYAVAWALNFYLLRTKTRGYAVQLRTIMERPVKPYAAEERIADFRKAFGKSPASMELDLRRYMVLTLNGAKKP